MTRPDPPPGQAPTELRRAPGRRVVLDRERGVVTKFFRGRSIAARLLDRRRARHEFAALERLAKAGVRVPRALGCERLDDGTWCVHMAAVSGARTALEALEDAAESGQAETLIGRLAELLASMHNASLDQPDLHGKNALVDAAGQAWAIDFHVARFQAPGMHVGTYLRDLVTLAAAHRESLPIGHRQRFLVCWRRALRTSLAAGLPDIKDLAIEVESRALSTRRATCSAYAKPTSRYFRISSSMAAASSPPTANFLARTDAPAANLAAAHAGQSSPALVCITGTKLEVEAAWGRVGRIAAHGLPGPRPLLLDRRDSARATAWFDFENDHGYLACTSPISEPSLPPSPAERAPLNAALAMRGLALKAPIPGAFRWHKDQLMLSHTCPIKALQSPQSAAKHKQSRESRRLRRERWARCWPYLCISPLAPLTRAALALAARTARYTPIEKRLRSNLAMGLPDANAAQITPQIRRHMARIAFEWGQLAKGQIDLSQTVEIDASVEYLDRALAYGRGVILITPHLGNWEFVGPSLVARGLRGTVIGRRRLRDPSGTLLEEMRAGQGLETLPQDSSPRDLMRRLADGQIVGILPDLEVQRLAGIRMPFLGKEALVVSAPAALARASKAPIVPVRCIAQSGPGKPYRLIFGAPIEAPQSREQTHAVTAQWVAVFEAWIREDPTQWLWIHDRWRTQPSAADSVPLSALRQVQADARAHLSNPADPIDPA